MPMLIPIAIAAAAGIGGYEASQGSGSSSTSTTQQTNAANLKQLQADQLAKQKAIQGNLANAQEQGGGALNGPSLTDLAATIAGLPGESGTVAGKGALAAFLGTGTGTGAGATGTPQDTMTSATYGNSLNGSMG